ncbi:hypothetical protein AM571_CH02371 [Rhizobium etli 8C-3]|uniref:Uncharacterized protein n=1 Tax=Rhizobium etli 8C-3 TaxID=538025 RepID=A0A1L5P4W1_RHIET|nr:hypothetical protein AM571_CH02371 [Rhizobium etli 8C-3]
MLPTNCRRLRSRQVLSCAAHGNAAQDDNLIDGLRRYLDLAAAGSFLNSLKIENCGVWIGEAAPRRLQIRLTETARSSQHPAYLAFRAGLDRSGGLERAYPAARSEKI